MSNYTFDPTNYGFEDIALFPEEIQDYFSVGYLKVIAVQDSDVFWFHQCRKVSHDDSDHRWIISHGVYDKRDPIQDFTLHEFNIRVIYTGIISSELFAISLLQNLMSLLRNDSIHEGNNRLNDRTMNDKLKV